MGTHNDMRAHSSALKILREYAVMTVGCILYAAGISLFVTQAGLSSGGMTGISITLHHFVGALPQGIWLLILNVPVLIIGFIVFGLRFMVRTGYATALSALLMYLFELIFDDTLGVVPFTSGVQNSVSAVIINATVGGVLFGVGMGLIFRMGATTAGTDILVKLLRKKFRHIQTGTISLTMDMIIICISYFTNYDVEKLFFTALSTVVFTIVFDRVLYGGNSAKTVTIITAGNTAENITKRILRELDSGVTVFNAKGAYTGEDKAVLVCVVKPFIYPNLRDIVREEDKTAFMIVSSAKEIYGEGYKNQDEAEL